MAKQRAVAAELYCTWQYKTRPWPSLQDATLAFSVFKNGCKVEALQLASIEKLERALAVYLVVAWRIARLMRLGRSCLDLDAELLFEREEWQAAYLLQKKPVLKKPPRLNEVVRLVAMLGGFLGRKGDGEPGVKTALARTATGGRLRSGAAMGARITGRLELCVMQWVEPTGHSGFPKADKGQRLEQEPPKPKGCHPQHCPICVTPQ